MQTSAENTKYEFVQGCTIKHEGKLLTRICALRDIEGVCKKGDLGGHLESEKNLDYEGNSWVSGNTRVYGNAYVTGSARVYGNAYVSGDAYVYGDARVYGDAYVSGDARVSSQGAIFWISNVGTENGTLTAYLTKYNSLQVIRGCFIGSVDEFLAASKEKHDDRTHNEYQLLIQVARSRIEHSLKEIEKTQ